MINKTDPRFDVMLDAGDSDFVEQLTKALGLNPGESVNIVTPQFTRTDGRAITYFPCTIEEYAALPQYREDTLKKMGCQKWERKEDTILWLFPHEWYSVIPDGLMITDIFWNEEVFERGKTDDDIRFGALSFGFKATAEP